MRIKYEKEHSATPFCEFAQALNPNVNRDSPLSSKLNNLNFFDYVNDVLTKLMKGETDYKSLIPCNYKPLPTTEEEQKEVA